MIRIAIALILIPILIAGVLVHSFPQKSTLYLIDTEKWTCTQFRYDQGEKPYDPGVIDCNEWRRK